MANNQNQVKQEDASNLNNALDLSFLIKMIPSFERKREELSPFLQQCN